MAASRPSADRVRAESVNWLLMSPNVSRSIRTEALPPEADREYLGIDGEVRVECDVDDVAREEFEGGRVGSGRGTGTDARARGTNGFFGNFDARSDADVNLYWEIQNLGLADRAIAKQRAAQQRTANPQLLKVQDRVASEVVRADKERIAASRQMAEAGRAVPACTGQSAARRWSRRLQ